MSHSSILLPDKARVPMALLGVTLSLILTACGGGGGAGGTAPPAASALQATNGTVTGFGSVYVDGVHIEDAHAMVQRENMDGTTTAVALRMGQRVRVAYDGQGNASAISVDAAVTGSVGSVDTTAGTLKVAGQWVRTNADSAAGPVTVFGGGYTALSDVAVADLVEVHGSPVYSSTRQAYEIQATRIEKQATISAVRVMGKLANLNASATTFGINGLLVNYAAATVVPTGTTLANDQNVVVWGPPASLTSVAGTPTLAATRVRVLTYAPSSAMASGMAQMGGLVSAYDTTNKTLEIQGIKVNVASAVITPSTLSLANGSYVQIVGTFDSSGVLVATGVRIRASDTVDDTARIRLSGAIGSLTDANSFVLRDVPVDATSATRAASCSGVTLATGVFVNVVARAQAGTNVVLATSIDCPSLVNMPLVPILQHSGTASNVDLTAKTFTLPPYCPAGTMCAGVMQSVLWTDQTAFTAITPQTLAGAMVKVEGYLNASGVLVAREIRKPDPSGLDAFDPPTMPAGPASSPMPGTGWDQYRNRHGG